MLEKPETEKVEEMEIQNGMNAFNSVFLNALQNNTQEEQHFSLRNNSAAATERSEPDTGLSSGLASYSTC